MTPTEAGTILTYCAEAWPNMKIGNETAVVWADGLANIDLADAQRAVRELAKQDEWAPSLARVVHAARGIESSRNMTPALGTGRNPEGARVLAAIRAASEAVERPEHDHRRGAEHCPCCTTKHNRIATFEQDVTGVLRDAGIIE